MEKAPPRIRPSPAGVVLAAVLLVGLVALFVASSHTVQLIGFIIVVLVAIVLLVEFRPRGRGARSFSTFLLRTESNNPRKGGRPPDQGWIDPDALHREREEQERRSRGPGRGA
jgi:hypothetical protein